MLLLSAGRSSDAAISGTSRKRLLERVGCYGQHLTDLSACVSSRRAGARLWVASLFPIGRRSQTGARRVAPGRSLRRVARRVGASSDVVAIAARSDRALSCSLERTHTRQKRPRTSRTPHRPVETASRLRSSRVVRLRHRTMTGQSCRWRLADAVGRCSLAGDSERPAPWNVCVLADDRESTAPGRCSAPPAPLRLREPRAVARVRRRRAPVSDKGVGRA
jgi:hypothetical protein